MGGALSAPVLHSVAERAPAFRGDIQGLRAVAVILVVIFHTGFALPGGFVGVDVFFVISGFLIIGLIDREVATSGRLDLRRFFARRVRRLLPALAVMTSATVPLSALIIEVGAPLGTVIRTAIGTSLLFANGVLYVEQDYFAPAAERNPLLHAWSLSVEEQFYIAVPVLLALLVLLVRRRHDDRSIASRWRHGAVFVLAVGTAGSFALSVLLVDRAAMTLGLADPTAFAFYSPATRAWEFGAGGLLALAGASPPGTRRGTRLDSATGAIGLVLILGAALLLDGTDPFPGFRALPVVLGTLLILRVGRDDARRVVGHVLDIPLLRWLGDLSYGWYLWHWPAIVLARALWGSSPLVVWSAVLASLALAALSFRFVEERFRHDASLVGLRAVGLAVLCAGVPLAIAAAISPVNAAVADRLDIGAGAESWSRATCHFRREPEEAWPRERCISSGDATDPTRSVDVLLIGDSHADALADGLLEATRRQGLTLGVLTVSSQPALGSHRWQDTFERLVDQERPRVVVLASRTSAYLNPVLYGHWTGASWVDEVTAVEEWVARASDAVSVYRSSGARVLWVHGVPEFPPDEGGRELGPTLVQQERLFRSLSLAELRAQRGGVVDAVRSALEGIPGVALFDPADVLCTPVCRNGAEDTYFYYDDNHLNATGSRLLTEELEAALAALLNTVRSG